MSQSEVPARHPEPAPTTTTQVANTNHNGHGRLREAIKALPGTLSDNTVMSAVTDPYRMDTPGNHRDSAWLAETMNRLGLINPAKLIHNRGIHYAIFGQPKPDGTPYTTNDWNWLEGVSNAARWLGYIEWAQIEDQRNMAPVIRVHKPGDPDPYLSVDYDVQVPAYEDLHPRVGLDGFRGTQPYRIAIIGEKSSLKAVLEPISRAYGADLLLPTGNLSSTQLAVLAKAAADDRRPLKLIYVADCDMSGWYMPTEVSHKLGAICEQLYPWVQFQTHRAALLPEHVRAFDLPDSPVKETDKRGDAWKAATGLEQTEVDSLATLRPELLTQIVTDMVLKFYDSTLDRRVAAVARQWREGAQAAADEQAGPDAEQLRRSAAEELEAHRADMQRIIDDIRIPTQGFDLPPIPDIPEPVIDESDHPEPLCDSRWPLEERNAKLKASRRFEDV
jgi:hypothetical protein